MSHPIVGDFVPRIRASNAPYRQSWTVSALRWTRALMSRISARSEGDTSNELFAYARKVEGELPNLAAELRFIASHRPDAPD